MRIIFALLVIFYSAVSAKAEQIDYVFQYANKAAAQADALVSGFVDNPTYALSNVTAKKISDGSTYSGYWIIVSSQGPIGGLLQSSASNTGYGLATDANLVIAVGRNAMNAGQPYTYMIGANTIANLNDLTLSPTFFSENFPFGNLAPIVTGAVPAKFFGMHIYSSNAPYVWTSAPFPALASPLGFSTPCGGWTYIQPTSQASYNYATVGPCGNPNGADAQFAVAESSGTEVGFSMGGTPGWAVANHTTNGAVNVITGEWVSYLPPDDRSPTGPIPIFLNDLLTKYNADTGTIHKAIRYIECWIEPATNALTTAQIVATYCQLINSYIHANWPLIKTTTPSLQPDSFTQPTSFYGQFFASYASQFGNAAPASDFDVVTWHGYGGCANIAALNTRFYRMLPLLQTYGLGTKPVIDSEGGWLTDVSCPSSTNQTNFASEWSIGHWNWGNLEAHWYGQAGLNWGTLTDNSGAPNAAGTAYKNVRSWILGATLAKTGCVIAQGTGQWTCNWTSGASVPFSTYFDTGGGPTTFTISGGYAACVDASSNAVTITTSTIPVTALPVKCQ